MELTTQNLRTLRTNFRALTLQGYQGVTAALHQQVATIVDSSTETESYNWLGSVPGVREFIGDRQVKNVATEAWTIRNRKWESTIGIDRAHIERDQFGTYKPLLKELGEAAAFHPDDLILDLLKNGFSRKGYDGKNFFAANHAAKGNATQSNVDTKKFSRANFLAARTGMLNRVNEEGRSLRLGKNLLLIVSPTYESDAQKVVEVETLEAGGGNPDKGKAKLLVLPDLAGNQMEHHWFLIETGRNFKPFFYQQEVALETRAITDPDDSQVFIKDQWMFGTYQRDAAGYGFWQMAFGSTGADPA